MKPKKAVKGCEYCKYRGSDFSPDPEFKEVIKCYCDARHTHVDAEMMTQFCDFFLLNPDYKPPKEESDGIKI